MEVIDLTAQRHHWAGECHCIDCKHEWVGVAPVETVWLECPQSKGHRGCPVHPMSLEEGELIYRCNCGCEYFFFSETNTLCGACGTAQVFD